MRWRPGPASRVLLLVGAWLVGCVLAVMLGIGAIDRALDEVSAPVTRTLETHGPGVTAPPGPPPSRLPVSATPPGSTPRPDGSDAARDRRRSAERADGRPYRAAHEGDSAAREPSEPLGSRTYAVSGGTVSVHCSAPGDIVLDLADPNDGYRMGVDASGPDSVVVSFEGAGGESQVHAECAGGKVYGETSSGFEEGSGEDGDTSGRSHVAEHDH